MTGVSTTYRVADVTVEVVRRDGGTALARSAYEPFRVPGRDDSGGQRIHVTALPGRCPVEARSLRFRSDETWSLWDADEGAVFAPAADRARSGVGGEAWIAPSFRRAQVYGLDPLSPVLEYPLDELMFLHLLPDLGGFLLHASAVLWGDGAYCFVGISGAGKSTTATLWESVRGTPVLSDDRVAVRMRGGDVWVYGTPWHGTAGRALGTGAPLRGLFLLTRSLHPYRCRVTPSVCLARLLPCLFLPHWDGGRTVRVLEVLQDVLRRVPVEETGFPPVPESLDRIWPREAAA